METKLSALVLGLTTIVVSSLLAQPSSAALGNGQGPTSKPLSKLCDPSREQVFAGRKIYRTSYNPKEP